MSVVRPVTVLLLGAIAALTLLVGWQVNRDVVVPMTTSTNGNPTGALPDVPKLGLRLPPVHTFSDIAERPLFVETRRPPAPETDGLASSNEPAPQWNLVGTAITEQDRAALLFDTRSRKFLVMRHGTSQSGWELADISPEGVVLEKGKAKHEIKLPRF